MKQPAIKLFGILLVGVLACIGGFVFNIPKLFFIGDALAWLLVGGFIYQLCVQVEKKGPRMPYTKIVARLIIFAAGNQFLDELLFDPTSWNINDFLVWVLYALNEVRIYRKKKNSK